LRTAALKIVAVIYAVFGLQMFLVPAFFMAENFKGWPEQGQAHYFLLFFMRMFGLMICTVATALWMLNDQLVLFKIFAVFNCIQVSLPAISARAFEVLSRTLLLQCPQSHTIRVRRL
jgi:hypothetical protein